MHKQSAPNVILAKILSRYCNRFERFTYLTQSDFVINGYLFYFLPSVKVFHEQKWIIYVNWGGEHEVIISDQRLLFLKKYMLIAAWKLNLDL